MEPSWVVNLRLDKLGRAGQAKIFKWTEPGRSGPKLRWAGPAVMSRNLAEPGRTV